MLRISVSNMSKEILDELALLSIEEEMLNEINYNNLIKKCIKRLQK